jgi:hypothetical protein
MIKPFVYFVFFVVDYDNVRDVYAIPGDRETVCENRLNMLDTAANVNCKVKPLLIERGYFRSPRWNDENPDI